MSDKSPMEAYFEAQRRKKPEYLRQKELEAEGWQLVGQEDLMHTKFQPDARFLPEEVQTKEEVEAKYLERFADEGLTEVMLVHPYMTDMNFSDDEPLENKKVVHVYMRKPENAP